MPVQVEEDGEGNQSGSDTAKQSSGPVDSHRIELEKKGLEVGISEIWDNEHVLTMYVAKRGNPPPAVERIIEFAASAEAAKTRYASTI